MKYLLDTHIFLWALFEPTKLTDKQKAAILDVNNDIFVSAISFWEISLKYSLKKLSLKGTRPEKLPEQAKKSGFQITKIDENLMASFYKLKKIGHKDPFDRLIIWEAIKGGYSVISSDRSFKAYKEAGLKML